MDLCTGCCSNVSSSQVNLDAGRSAWANYRIMTSKNSLSPHNPPPSFMCLHCLLAGRRWSVWSLHTVGNGCQVVRLWSSRQSAAAKQQMNRQPGRPPTAALTSLHLIPDKQQQKINCFSVLPLATHNDGQYDIPWPWSDSDPSSPDDDNNINL